MLPRARRTKQHIQKNATGARPHLVFDLRRRVVDEDGAGGVAGAHLAALALQRREEPAAGKSRNPDS